jgi:parallel beta-helix repeat protein
MCLFHYDKPATLWRPKMPKQISLLITLFIFAIPCFANVPAGHSTLQEAIDAASNGDVIIVTPDTYAGDNNKNLDFNGKSITLKCDSQAASCTIDCENSGRGVYFHSNEDENTILSGFIITNGNVPKMGGGILCVSSSPTITNCVITHNTARWARGGNGGGIACKDASPKIYNTTIQYNEANINGGGIYCRGNSNPVLDSCVVSNNSKAIYGGGISAHEQSNLTIINSLLYGNSARQGGGGLSCTSSPTVQNSVISNNSAIDGGGIASYYSSPTIDSSLVSSNSAVNGGGIAAQALSKPIITNSSISNNSASKKGSGVSLYPSAEPTITGCTIWSTDEKDAIEIDTSEEIVTENQTGLALVSDSAVQGGYTGDQNVDIAPASIEGLINEYSGENQTFTLTGGGLTAYRYRLDDETEWREEMVISIPIGLTQLTNGEHTLYVLGKDALGNWLPEDTAIIVQWTVDTTAPIVQNITDSFQPCRSITWSWQASESAEFRYLIDNTSNGVPTGEYSNITSVTQSTGDGIYYLHVQAKDMAGNESAVQTVQATLDNQPPDATIQYSETAPTSNDILATLIPSETVTVSNNNGAFTRTFSENGTFTFTFSDAAGNTGSATAEVDWISNYFQIVDTLPQNPTTLTQTTFYMDINYTNTQQSNTLQGLGLRIHYPSQAITFQGISNILEPVHTPASDHTETTETDDGNDNTDRYIEMAWQDESMNWPGQELPVRLCTVAFTPASDLDIGYTCTIIYQASQTHPGYLFYANPVTMEIQRFTLDVDGNMDADALTDGLLIIRYLFGLKGGQSLTENAVDIQNGTRLSSESIGAYIESGIPYLDIDGNNRSDALTDGILILRYLFGIDEGNNLINEAVDPAGTRTSSEAVQTYIESLIQ